MTDKRDFLAACEVFTGPEWRDRERIERAAMKHAKRAEAYAAGVRCALRGWNAAECVRDYPGHGAAFRLGYRDGRKAE